MSLEFTIEIFREMLTVALLMVTPMLATALSVGVTVSLLQAVTSIQEQTLSFVPKLFAVVAVMMVSAFWLAEQIIVFTTETFERISSIGTG